EIHFGELHNPHAHAAIVKDRGLFERVQRRSVSRGRQAKSERLSRTRPPLATDHPLWAR
ncbi:MAG: hypothetical protein JO046_11770, partial [Solirubrobacterales bacterium]|nr:hypothetical protein [Solirubrobacterales bacterium]